MYEIKITTYSRPFALFEYFFAWPAILIYLFHIVIISAAIPLALIEVLPDYLSLICVGLAFASVHFTIKWLKNKFNNFFYLFIVAVAFIYNVSFGVMATMMYSRSEEISVFDALNSIGLILLVFYCFSFYYHKWIFHVYQNR